jgi:hypothetical protein
VLALPPATAAVKLSDRCLAQFFVGEWHTLKGQSAAAAAALSTAVDMFQGFC